MNMPQIVQFAAPRAVALVNTGLTGWLGTICLRICINNCPKDSIGGIEIACALKCLNSCSGIGSAARFSAF